LHNDNNKQQRNRYNNAGTGHTNGKYAKTTTKKNFSTEKTNFSLSIFSVNILIMIEALPQCFVLGSGRGSRFLPFPELREGIAGAAVSPALCSRARTCHAYRCTGHN
jgi:hypothetical protein